MDSKETHRSRLAVGQRRGSQWCCFSEVQAVKERGIFTLAEDAKSPKPRPMARAARGDAGIQATASQRVPGTSQAGGRTNPAGPCVLVCGCVGGGSGA